MRSFDSTLQDDVVKADGNQSESSKNVSSPIKNVVPKNDSPLKDPPPQKVLSASSSPNVGSYKSTTKNLSSTESVVSPPAKDSPVKNVIRKTNPATAKILQQSQSQKICDASSKMSPAPLEIVDASSNVGFNAFKSPPYNVASPPPGPHLLNNKGNRKVEPHKFVPKEVSPANSQDNSSKANLIKEKSLSQEKECKSSNDTEQKSSIESGAIKSVKDIAKHVESMQQPKDNGRELPKSNNKGASSVKSIFTDLAATVMSTSEENDTEGNGVGNKIKQFEKAAEGLNSRPGSIRRRSRSEQSERDSNQFQPKPDHQLQKEPEMEIKSITSNESTLKWRKDSIEYYQSDTFRSKFEQPKTIKQDQKLPPQERSILSPPSNVKSIHEKFSQPYTRNVQPLQAHLDAYQQDDDTACKTNKIIKEKHCHRSNAYFTRGTEEIWLVKKKDIEEIEDRVLESFRRAGGNPDAFRPSADAQASFSSTLGRNKRPIYTRSESSDPQWANTRAHTLRRQTSVACTCSHDKKNRPVKGNGNANEPPRPRSRSQGDDNSQEHVLDKYETLV